MQDIYIGKENKENNRMAELMKYSNQEVSVDSVAQETPEEVAPNDQTA
jgi:hypothetical protein